MPGGSAGVPRQQVDGGGPVQSAGQRGEVHPGGREDQRIRGAVGDACQAGRNRHRQGHSGKPSGRYLPALLPGGGPRPAWGGHRPVSGPGDRHPAGRLYQGGLGGWPGVCLFRVPAPAMSCSQKIHI